MKHDELQAMLSHDALHRWCRGRRQVLRAELDRLLPAPAAAVRIAQRHRHAHARSDLELTPPSLNGVLALPLRVESRLVASGLRLPAGLSLLAVLRRSAVPGAGAW